MAKNETQKLTVYLTQEQLDMLTELKQTTDEANTRAIARLVENAHRRVHNMIENEITMALVDADIRSAWQTLMQDTDQVADKQLRKLIMDEARAKREGKGHRQLTQLTAEIAVRLEEKIDLIVEKIS